ncbi:integrase [Kitasatospora sp. NPDC005856]|uniref:integrase n=1 Tax=Kitasatospora sp. NPDC005856 TaxID=3154566 RepID=UPI0034053741
MNLPAQPVRSVSAFDADEPVLSDHVLLPFARSPRFGELDEWSFNDVLRRPANLSPGGWKLNFTSLEGKWVLRGRELAMIALNPRHPRVVAAGIPSPRRPVSPRTVVILLGSMRLLAAWAREHHLPDDLGAWRDHHLHAFVADQRQRLTADTTLTHVRLVQELHRCGPLLTGGGLATNPWPGMSARAVAGVTWTKENRAISTPAIPPATWFPLINAAWTYIDRFASDIVGADALYERLRENARSRVDFLAAAVRRWLRDPRNLVPLHHAREPAVRNVGGVHWSLLALKLGYARETSAFKGGHRGARAAVMAAVERGQCRPAGLLDEYAQVVRADGTTGPWHPGLDPRCLYSEIRVLRTACYVFVAALSMMRDGEIQEITKGSVVQYFGAPAIASAKHKGEEDFPIKHWWIIEPVARAIAVAEELSPDDERVFTGVRSRTAGSETFNAAERIMTFIEHVNATTQWTGLSQIGAGRVSPHMFRRTMSMLTDQFPGSEIALGIQLKHAASRALANRVTQGYAVPAADWTRFLDQAVEAARFRGLRELFALHREGQPVGFGPGAEQLKGTFDTIAATAAAQGGDALVEEGMLRRARISIRFGTLNNCLFDEASPAGAVCLEKAVVPPGHTGPLVDRCRPDRCGNSMIGHQHVPIWESEERGLAVLLEAPGLPPARRAALERQRAEAQAILRKAGR